MRFVLFIFTFSVGFLCFSQIENAKMLKKKDPMIGYWKFVPTNEINSPAPILDSEEFISLLPGEEESGFACCYIEPDGYACPSYFIAKKDASKFYCLIRTSCITPAVGQVIEFEYRFFEEQDQLQVIINGQTYLYERFTP